MKPTLSGASQTRRASRGLLYNSRGLLYNSRGLLYNCCGLLYNCCVSSSPDWANAKLAQSKPRCRDALQNVSNASHLNKYALAAELSQNL